MIYFDLDDFKAVNSRYTETAVDRDLLPDLQKLISEAATSIGNTYREGGDELVALLPNATLEMGAAFAEALRALIAERDFTVNQESVTLTASFGVAFGTRDTLPDVFKDNANVAKKEAKNRGKNCVCLFKKGGFEIYKPSIPDA